MFSDILQVGIYVPVRGLSPDEMDYWIKQEQVASLALHRLLEYKISWKDYLDILELCDVDIDDYLQTVDDNFSLIT